MKNILRLSLFAFVLPIAISVSSLHAANPLTPFTPADRVLDPNCLPTDSNCYVSNTTISNLNITGQAPIIIGPELIVNGNFATGTSGWNLYDCGSYNAGVITMTYTACNQPYVSTPVDMSTGKTYLLTFTISGAGGKGVYVYDQWSTSFFNYYPNDGTENGTHTIVFKNSFVGADSIYFEQAYDVSQDGGTFSVDNVSVKEINNLAPSLSVKDYAGSSVFSLGSDIQKNIALGKKALGSNTSGTNNLAIGENALFANLTGYYNIALGEDSLTKNVGGNENIATGVGSLLYNINGNNNVAYGTNSLRSNVNGNGNVGIGIALGYNKNGSQNVSIGNYSGQNIGTSSNNVLVGHGSGQGNSSYGSLFTSSANTMIGTESGFNLATSTGNLFLGYRSAFNQTLGDYNILLGYNNNLASTTSSNQLNIGNLIYGTSLGINGIASTGKIGIGTSTPSHLLTVGNTSVSGVVSRFQNSTGYCDINPTTTSLTCTSDSRLKKNIVSLSTSSTSTLSRLTNLNPVMYNWLSEDNASSTHAGFIAQEVRPLFPDLVSEDENGTLSVAYGGFVVYVVEALKEIAGVMSGWRESFTSKTICVGEEGDKTCISKSQLDSLLLLQQQTNTNTSAPASPTILIIGATIEEVIASSTETLIEEVIAPVSEDLTTVNNNTSTTTNEN